MTARVEAERAIADVLAGHSRRGNGCLCGVIYPHYQVTKALKGTYSTFNQPAHDAHLSSVLADLMAERQAEAWACDCGGTVTSEVWLRCSNPGCQSNHFVVSTYWHPSPDPKDTRDE